MTGPTNCAFYRATSERNDWDNPTRAQLIKSVNDGHDANRQLEAEMGRLRGEVQKAKKNLFFANTKIVVLMAMIGGCAAKGIEVAVIALIKVFAR
jgi:hypothetical protein